MIAIPGELQDLIPYLKAEEPSLYRQPMPDSEWHAVAGRIAEVFGSGGGSRAAAFAGRIQEQILRLDPMMSRHCAATCSSCPDPCCTGKRVYYNFTDLLFLTALDAEMPPGQTRTRDGQPCRYLGTDGCQIPRTMRPYVCTWFLCDAHMERLSAERPLFQREVNGRLQQIRLYRLALAALYDMLSGPSAPIARNAAESTSARR